MQYDARKIEKKWKAKWEASEIYKVTHRSDKPKYYVLDMFPYPSGAGLHVGHPLGYIASDIYARFKRMEGYNVLHPMGFDAFGLPAEQYAIQSGVHPAESTAGNIERYRDQLGNLGLNYDWSRIVVTCDPDYYKWTQWIFLQLYGHFYDPQEERARPIEELEEIFSRQGTDGLPDDMEAEAAFSGEDWQGMSRRQRDEILMNYRLAYRKVAFVNWCEELGTVLANDEVKDGLSERGGHPVVRKAMMQWSLRITAYAERLLADLEELEWTESLKTMQRNWIGKSVGARLFFPIDGHGETIEVFTTRPDTVFGATFMVLAPEHPFVGSIVTDDRQEEVSRYVAYVKTRSERDRIADTKKITGAFTGAYAIQPFTGDRIPIWISEYVLMDYGTGAIMAVPSDDARDQAFAEHFGLEIIPVVDKSDHPDADIHDKVGTLINSGFITGMQVPQAIDAIIDRAEKEGIGRREVNFRLRDAIFSRQRYWGEPVPVVYDKEGVSRGLDPNQLPLELPELMDFAPTSDGKSPLSKAPEWTQLGDGWMRETDTMPGYAGSSWYFLRYMDAHNDESFAGKEAIAYWRDVDLYIGGTEHAVGHLLYARFWHKFLFDLGYVPTVEPFRKLINQGMIQGVIEYLYLGKEKVDGGHQFVSAELVAEGEADAFIRIPSHVDFVREYGTKDSYLDMEGIRRFVEWRPEYREASFACANGIIRNGQLTGDGAVDEVRFQTHSEIGKMSKRYFNVVNPDDVVDQYGADCFRMYEMFLGPIEQSKPWDTNGIDGVSKFLRRYWSLFYDEDGIYLVQDQSPSETEWKILHRTIKKVREDLERFSFNTCVSAFMVCVNELKKEDCHKRSILMPLTALIAPFAPHIAEELWHIMDAGGSVVEASFPVHDESRLKESRIEYPVAINGKKRAEASFPAEAGKEELESAALELDAVQKWLEGKTVRKVIVVPKRMINIVVS